MARFLATPLKNAFSTRVPFAAGLLIAVFWVVFGFTPSSLQVAGSKASAAGGAQRPARTLSFEERVRYQRAVEEVYWRHTVWPKQNAGPKPMLDEVASLDVTRARIEDVLRKSDALARQWKSPVTAEQLQAEAARMAHETRLPEVLRELWQALDNDPFVIAEVLARPALVERLARSYYSSDRSLHGALRAKAEAQLREHTTIDALRNAGGKFSEVEAVKVARKSARAVDGAGASAAAGTTTKGKALELTADEWDVETARLREMLGAESCETCDGAASLPAGGMSSLQEDDNSFYVSSVVASTGKRLKVARVEWTKTSFDSWWSGARTGLEADATTEGFDYKLAQINQLAADDTWTPTKALPEATGTAVWTGTEMIIWGGGKLNSGARYNPATDTWTPTSTTNVPTHRSGHTAVWTGMEMIIWGGCERSFDFCGTNDGGRYNPVSDTWATISLTNAPTARSRHVAVWTGSKMIIWAGLQHGYNNQGKAINSGGIYDPANNSWTTMNTTDAPTGGSGFTVVWTGSEMIAWGGNTSFGGRYNPDTNRWTPTNPVNAPSPRTGHTAVWTGTEMIIWGGTSGSEPLNTGGRYNPANDTWTPTSTTDAPGPRYLHTAVWTGTEMIVWGGSQPLPTNTGGRYNPSTDTWTPTNTANAPPPKSGHVAVWTGELMIVWSVTDNKTGGRYNPANDSWTPTDNNDSPPPVNLGVWSGAEMIVWSHNAGCLNGCLSSGKRYDPATYSWRPMSNVGAPVPPPADRPITAVWTGSEMIVWGANDGQYTTPGEGGRYNPLTDSWRPVTTAGAPVNRFYFTGVWSGSEMIVWGGQSNEGTLQNTGGRYNPSTDTWRPTNTTGAPEARYIHTAVWTGTEMIVWGGSSGSLSHLNTGGRYNPSNDTWTPTNTGGAPEARRYHTAVWTGTEMIIWGGRIDDYNNSEGLFNTGGRYNPSIDAWTPTSMTGVPSPRFKHTAVWTGELMIVWGGIAKNALGYAVSTNTGGRYNPSSDAWTPTSTLRAPGRRHDHIAFWTGTGMLVWGGYAEDGSASHGGYYSAPGASNGNTPPSVRITAPADNSTFESGATINITTETSDTDGTISVVHFYANDSLIGSDSTAPFNFSWPEVRGGSYTIKAVATDDAGGMTTSAAVRLTVNPSTAPPSCVLNTPVNNSNYTAPATLAFKATASANRDRTLKTVQFFDGTRSLGTFGPGGSYAFTYSGLQEGTYTFTVRCTDSADVSVTSPANVVTVSGGNTSTVRITGQITDSQGSSISNVRVRLDAATGTTPQFSTTNLNGSFQFGNLPGGGNYTVTPESAIYTFSPPTLSFQSLTQNYDNANFRAQNISHTISGRLTDAGGKAIHPATITLSGSKTASTATDFNGNYFFSNLAPGGNYTVQPFKNQYSFAPPTQTFTNLSAQQTADFVGTPMTYIVGGRITNGGGAAIAGVTVSLSGTSSATATTDASGSYSFANLAAGGNYTVTPSKSGYNFTPGSRSYVNLAGNQTSDFRGVAVSQSVTLQAEDFDDAWEGMAYHDTTEGNLGGHYRASGVDITNCPGGTCAYMVGWNKAGEWLYYTVSIAETGTYTLSARVANTASGGTFHVEIDGSDATGALAMPNTGDPYGWATVTKSGLNLTAGQHSIKLFMDKESTQGWAGNFDSFSFTKEQPPPQQGSRHNAALASNGGVATASSQYNGSFPAAAAINGDRTQLYLPDGRYNMWHSAAGASKPDWIQVEFSGARAIDEIVVVTQQDDFTNAVEPTEATTFTKYGLTAFDVQYWNGTTWNTVTGGVVTGNDRVLRRISFPAVTTTRIRLLVRSASDGFSRVWELEAWGSAVASQPTDGRVNVAAASNGASAFASSQYDGNFPASAAINGDRHRLFLPDGRYNMWHSATGAAKPDWLQVNFNGTKTITEINVATMQDDYQNPVEPTEATTFSAHGLTHFQVQYWDGSNWATVSGGSVTANDRVWRRFTFPALTTDKIRVLVSAAADGYSRIMEVEAY